MKYIGLLVVAHENDILQEVLEQHSEIVDCFYALDGTVPNKQSAAIIQGFDKCAGYWTDADLPRPPYPEGTTCGYRQWPYERAVADYGPDNWFVQLHGDEIWTFDPRDAVAKHPEADGFIFPLPFYFPTEWDAQKRPFEQLHWHYTPGWPEFRLFKGGPNVFFDPEQHFDTKPRGVDNVVHLGWPIKHYPYRSPRVQREKAALHSRTGYDPDNYTHILNGDNVLWTPEMIAAAYCEPHQVVKSDRGL